MDQALAESTHDALTTDWILDCDATVKLLYGHQDGAEIGYNPTKPGRPSHTIHTYWIANVRLVLDAEVQDGKAHAAKHSLPRTGRRLASESNHCFQPFTSSPAARDRRHHQDKHPHHPSAL